MLRSNVVEIERQMFFTGLRQGLVFPSIFPQCPFVASVICSIWCNWFTVFLKVSTEGLCFCRQHLVIVFLLTAIKIYRRYTSLLFKSFGASLRYSIGKDILTFKDFGDCSGHFLQKWFNLRTSSEYRCIIVHRRRWSSHSSRLFIRGYEEVNNVLRAKIPPGVKEICIFFFFFTVFHISSVISTKIKCISCL